jgi:hypothetical protein
MSSEDDACYPGLSHTQKRESEGATPLEFGKPDRSDGFMGSSAVGNEHSSYLFTVLGQVGAKALYTYDFGDSWVHAIAVEKVLPPESGVAYPICVGGQLQGPPEDRALDRKPAARHRWHPRTRRRSPSPAASAIRATGAAPCPLAAGLPDNPPTQWSIPVSDRRL